MNYEYSIQNNELSSQHLASLEIKEQESIITPQNKGFGQVLRVKHHINKSHGILFCLLLSFFFDKIKQFNGRFYQISRPRISKALGMFDVETIEIAINKMQKLGYIEIKACGGYHNINSYRLTPKGIAYFEEQGTGSTLVTRSLGVHMGSYTYAYIIQRLSNSIFSIDRKAAFTRKFITEEFEISGLTVVHGALLKAIELGILSKESRRHGLSCIYTFLGQEFIIPVLSSVGDNNKIYKETYSSNGENIPQNEQDLSQNKTIKQSLDAMGWIEPSKPWTEPPNKPKRNNKKPISSENTMTYREFFGKFQESSVQIKQHLFLILPVSSNSGVSKILINGVISGGIDIAISRGGTQEQYLQCLAQWIREQRKIQQYTGYINLNEVLQIFNMFNNFDTYMQGYGFVRGQGVSQLAYRQGIQNGLEARKVDVKRFKTGHFAEKIERYFKAGYDFGQAPDKIFIDHSKPKTGRDLFEPQEFTPYVPVTRPIVSSHSSWRDAMEKDYGVTIAI